MGTGSSLFVPYDVSAQPSLLLLPVGLLALAVVLGGLIGWQREMHDQPAGFRTHILVTVGATLATLVSQSYARDVPARIAANVVVGVGFLGAGTIMRQESSVRGLTTAASLWVCACIGIAVGHGGSMVVLAIACTLLVFIVLSLFGNVERRWIHGQHRRGLTVIYDGLPEHRAAILGMLEQQGCVVVGVSRDEHHRAAPSVISLFVRLPQRLDFLKLSDQMMRLEWVQALTWA